MNTEQIKLYTEVREKWNFVFEVLCKRPNRRIKSL